MDYDAQKASREQLKEKARRSAAAPFFNYVTENWCSVAAARPNLDGKEVQELLWLQWVRKGEKGKATVRGDIGAAIVGREKGAKRIKTVINLEKVKLEGGQVEPNRGNPGKSEVKEENLALFKDDQRK